MVPLAVSPRNFPKNREKTVLNNFRSQVFLLGSGTFFPFPRLLIGCRSKSRSLDQSFASSYSTSVKLEQKLFSAFPFYHLKFNFYK